MHLVIVGNGIAGITCARHVRKLAPQTRITVVSGESAFHYSRPALMYLFMGHMREADLKPYEDWFWAENRIELVHDWVEEIDFATRALHLRAGAPIEYDQLVLATGSVTTYHDWPGQDLDGVHGLVTLDDVAAMERHSARGIERAVVVGGGLIGIEMVECLHTRGIPVSFLVREDSYWNKVLPPEESALVTAHIRTKHGVDLRLNTELSEIWGQRSGQEGVRAVVLKGGEKIVCQFVGISTGVEPNVDFLKLTDLKIDRGIVVDDHLRTNLPDVYAVGDCAQIADPQPGRRPIEAIWYTGRLQGETVAHTICGRPTPYRPRLFFNSAKFFDIEYQVYGETPAVLPEGTHTCYWQHPEADKSVRLYWDAHARGLTGVHLLGVRFRQEVCERWIIDRTPIEEVVAHLGLADFDPEFFEEIAPGVVDAFNRQQGTSVKLATRRGLPAVQRWWQRLRGAG